MVWCVSWFVCSFVLVCVVFVLFYVLVCLGLFWFGFVRARALIFVSRSLSSLPFLLLLLLLFTLLLLVAFVAATGSRFCLFIKTYAVVVILIAWAWAWAVATQTAPTSLTTPLEAYTPYTPTRTAASNEDYSRQPPAPS